MTDPLNPMPMVDPMNFGGAGMKSITDAVSGMIEPVESTIDLGGITTQYDALRNALAQLPQRTQSDAPRTSNFDQDFSKYKSRMSELVNYAPAPNFYDMASDLGAALLSDPMQNPFVGAGKGFSAFNERVKKQAEDRRIIDQKVAMQALQMAMDDERRAEEYLNQRDLKQIELQAKPYDPLQFEVDVIGPDGQPTGERKMVSVDPRNVYDVAAIKADPSAVEVKTPTSQTTIKTGGDGSELAKAEGKNLAKLHEELAKAATDGRAQNNLTSMFLAKLNKIGKNNYGVIAGKTLGLRRIGDELGIRYDSNLADQEVVQMLGTRIAMKLIGQTKGAITEMEMRLFLAASPGLSQTFEGAQLQAKLLERIANQNINLSRDYNAAQNTIHTDDMNDAQRANATRIWIDKWHENNPFLTGEERLELERATKTIVDPKMRLETDSFVDKLYGTGSSSTRMQDAFS
jgi:hypothetical protein|tara:strand:- start:216 stop:1592 length:1377 start_codon:yes stop_codon:yes gene_type:complete